jgi:hypothetical protein
VVESKFPASAPGVIMHERVALMGIIRSRGIRPDTYNPSADGAWDVCSATIRVSNGPKISFCAEQLNQTSVSRPSRATFTIMKDKQSAPHALERRRHARIIHGPPNGANRPLR